MINEKSFFSIKSCYENIEKQISPLLDTYNRKQIDLSNVNKLLELYNVKIFFDKGEKCKYWTEEEYKQKKQILKEQIYYINFIKINIFAFSILKVNF